MRKKLTIVTSAYRSERYLPAFLANMAQLENREECRLLLILNEPTAQERAIATNFAQDNRDFLVPHFLDFRETIGASTNRGLGLAETEYVAYADVDDARPVDTYIRQLKTLEQNPDVDFTYGDFILVSQQGEKRGQLISVPEFNPVEFIRGSFVGPGHCFRRTLLERSGYWDEQLRSGGDFDFQIRAALHGKFRKTQGEVAYYTKDGTASAASTAWQAIDALTICFRYGIYDQLHLYLHHLPETAHYRIHQLLQFGEWQSVAGYVPNYINYLEDRRQLIEKTQRRMTYFWLKRRLRTEIRSFSEQVGCLQQGKTFLKWRQTFKGFS